MVLGLSYNYEWCKCHKQLVRAKAYNSTLYEVLTPHLLVKNQNSFYNNWVLGQLKSKGYGLQSMENFIRTRVNTDFCPIVPALTI